MKKEFNLSGKILGGSELYDFIKAEDVRDFIQEVMEDIINLDKWNKGKIEAMAHIDFILKVIKKRAGEDLI